MSGLGRLKAAHTCGAGVSFDAAEVDELMQLITEHDGVECTKHDALVKGAVAMADSLEQSALGLTERLKNAQARIQKLTKAAERVYQLRNEAPAGDKFVEFYNAIIRLGHALKDVPAGK